MASSAMFSRHTLKSFVQRRLFAAAEEIFVVVERIITEYEDQAFSSKQQIEKQQRILDVVLKPQIKLHRTDIPEKRQRVNKKTLEVENEDDDEDFPGFPAIDDSLEHEEGSSMALEEPQSPPQGQGETGWSTLRLQDVKSRGDTLSADFTVQEDASLPEIKEEPEELLIIPQIADTSSSTLISPDSMSGAYTETERQESNGPWVKRGTGRSPGRPRKVYLGRKRGRPPGSKNLDKNPDKNPDSCARTNAPGYVRRPSRHPVYPISHVTARQETTSTVVERGGGRPLMVYRGWPVTERQEVLHMNNIDSLHLPALKEEPEEEESNSSLDCGTSRPPAEEQLLCPLSYHSDTEDDDHDHDDWEQTRQAPPVRKSQRSIKRERYTEDGDDSEQTWEAPRGRKPRRIIKRERPSSSSSVIDELSHDLKPSTVIVKTEGQTLPTRTDRGEKALYCTFCGKKFGSNAGLKLHVMIHTGERPHGCRFCDKRFRLKGNAKGHERTHTGEKPYSCVFCGQRFSQKGNMTIHTKKYCGKDLFSSPKIEDPQA